MRISINKMWLALLSLLPVAAFAYAGMVDGYINILYAEVTAAYSVTTVLVVMMLAVRYNSVINRYFPRIGRFTSRITDRVVTVGKVAYVIAWIMVLFTNSLMILLAMVLMYPVVKKLNNFEWTYIEGRLAKRLFNIVLTIVAIVALWMFMYFHLFLCGVACELLIPDCLSYRSIRDGIYNAISFDINYISGLLVVHAAWMVGKYLWSHLRSN